MFFMKRKTKLLSSILLLALLLCSCGQQESENSSNEPSYGYNETSSAETERVLEIKCAVDLFGERLSDITASGFECDMIETLNDYDLKTAKPYTILMDDAQIFPAAVICKDDAVIAGEVETSRTMFEIDENFDPQSLYWSAAFQAHYTKRILTIGSSGDEYNLNYMWCPPDPSDILTVDGNRKSNCAMIYQGTYAYITNNDFMWFDWGTSIYDVQASLVDKGFSLKDSELLKNSIETKSVSEKLYGNDFYIVLTYNDNMQFTKGAYQIYGGSNAERADIFEAACKDLIAKYGDTVKLSLSPKFDSIDEQLAFMRRETGSIDPYQFVTSLSWNFNNYTYITLYIYGWHIEIEYKSIASTGGTHLNEDSLI